MKQTIEMILMALVIMLIAALMGTTMTSCTSDDEGYDESSLYAIVLQEGATPIDILPEDYVLTIDNIVSVNPTDNQFILKNTERIDSLAFPIPIPHVIQFYADGRFLFEAKLTSVLSSAISSGISFCYYFTNQNRYSKYKLEINKFALENGTIKGELTREQAQGIERMYRILKSQGKITFDKDYDD